jgi:hypothetical protein
MASGPHVAGGVFKAAQPRELFATSITGTHHNFPQFAVTQDAQRFIINTWADFGVITLYANWDAEKHQELWHVDLQNCFPPLLHVGLSLRTTNGRPVKALSGGVAAVLGRA